MNRNEIFWFLGTSGLALVLSLVLFGFEGFKTDAAFDINIHDTYFVIANIHIVPFLLVFTFFTVYLFRAIKHNFKIFTANVILIIATILFIILLGKTIGLLDFISKPTNNTQFMEEKDLVGYVLTILSRSMFILQTGLLVLLAYCGFKTGQNFKSKKNIRSV